MKIDYTVYFEDGSSKIVNCEKPAGAHPTSIMAMRAGVTEAEKTGKRVKTIARTKTFLGNLVDVDSTPRHELFV